MPAALLKRMMTRHKKKLLACKVYTEKSGKHKKGYTQIILRMDEFDHDFSKRASFRSDHSIHDGVNFYSPVPI